MADPRTNEGDSPDDPEPSKPPVPWRQLLAEALMLMVLDVIRQLIESCL